MTLNLAIADLDRLDNGVPARLRLERHGAVIGRSPQADWTLPDPQSYISSTHCEIDYRGGAYVLTDKSTNGVFINGSQARLAAPHVIADGDVIMIGSYRIVARLEGAGAPTLPSAQPIEPHQGDVWGAWPASSPSPAPTPAPGGWDRPEPLPAISGMGALSEHWAPPRVDRPAASPWGEAIAPVTPASAWSSPVPETPPPPSAADVWGRLADGNAVDWNRGGFGAPPPVALTPAASPDPLGLAVRATGIEARPPTTSTQDSAWAFPSSTPPADTGAAAAWGAPPPPVRPMDPAAAWGAPPAPVGPPAPGQVAGGEWTAFLAGAGVSPGDVRADPRSAMTAAGDLLRRLVAGMVVMLEARARAKAQLGAQGTIPGLDNNPLKFARSPERALSQLLNAPERGFMPADRAVEDAFRDLQAHQMATLIAMQGALSETLARFSPQAIRERAETRGLLAKILPAAREAELWNAYQREFEGVARGSDEAFMDVFAKQFRQAYEKAAADMKARG
jgi:type VI secretion system FHA domain protein